MSDDNTDKALINRALIDFGRQRSLQELPTSQSRAYRWDVPYHDFGYYKRIGPGTLTQNTVQYVATVQLWMKNGRAHGEVMRRAADLKLKPNDPLIRYLIETGAAP